MESAAKSPLEQDFTAALDWWREAGVEWDYSDAAQSWLAEPELVPGPDEQPEERHPVLAPPPALGRLRAPAAMALDLAQMPGDHAAFVAWWLAEPSLDGGRVTGRIQPRGNPGATTMILVPEPERDDTETLLSGPQGKLLEGFLRVAGMAPDSVYVASVLPRATPHADWEAMASAGIGNVLARHVALAAPQRIIALTGNILSLIGHGSANKSADSNHFQHEQGSVPLLTGRDLGVLLERPRWKAGLWQAWLDWDAGG